MSDDCLLIDVAHQGEIRLARVLADCPEIRHITKFASDSIPTLTDALLRFERETDQPLYGTTAVIAIAGPASGDSIPIARTRWNISRSGLASLLGRPAVILNEVAARAWATVGRLPAIEPIRGSGVPDLATKGRYLFISIGDGVGTATIDIDDSGRVTVLDGEGGHADFAPQSEAELKLAKALSPISGCATWEQALMIQRHRLPANVLPDLSDRALAEMAANHLGRFVANAMVMTAGWSGAMIAGHGVPHYDDTARRAFDAGFSTRRSFLRLFKAARCWRIEQQEPVLSGAAAYVLHRHQSQDGR